MPGSLPASLYFMSKFICYIDGRPIVQGHKRYEFIWDEALYCYVFRGKAFTEAEFNDMTKAVFSNALYRSFFPQVKCLEETPSDAPIETIDDKTEITLDQALDIVERLAPHRLKKKPGPREVAATG